MTDKTSCIVHPAKNPLVMIRECYLQLTDGDQCAAMLLAHFEYLHNGRIDNAREAEEDIRAADICDERPEQSTTMWVYRSYADLRSDMFDLFSIQRITVGVKLLLEKGYVTTRRNPRYKWDHKPQYQFMPIAVQNDIDVAYDMQVVKKVSESNNHRNAVGSRRKSSTASTIQ